MISLQRMEGRFCGITETDFHIPPAPPTSVVAVFKQVEHGLATSSKSPKVAFALVISLRPRNLFEISDSLISHHDTTKEGATALEGNDANI